MWEKIEFSDSMLDFRDDAKKLELFDKKFDDLKNSWFKKKKLLSVLNSELENTKTEESFYMNDKDTNKEEIEKDIKDISSYKKRLKNLIDDIEKWEEIENEIIDKSFLETAFSFDTEEMFKDIKISFKKLDENIAFEKWSDFEKRKFEVSSFIQIWENRITIVDQKVFDLIDWEDWIKLVESEKYKLSDKEDSIYIEKVEESNIDKKNSVDEKEDNTDETEDNKKPKSEKNKIKLIDNPIELKKRFKTIMEEHKFRYYPIARELWRELSKDINSIKDLKKLRNNIDLQFWEKQLYTDEEIETKKQDNIYIRDQKHIVEIIKFESNLVFIKNSKDIRNDLIELENWDFLDKKSKSKLYQNLLSNDERLPIEKFTKVLENLDTKIYSIDLYNFSDEQIYELKPTLDNLIANEYIEASQINYPKRENLNNN